MTAITKPEVRFATYVKCHKGILCTLNLKLHKQFIKCNSVKNKAKIKLKAVAFPWFL